MTKSVSDLLQIGIFLPTTRVYDVEEVNLEPDLKRLLVQLYQSINDISIAINLKQSGIYSLEEIQTSQAFFPDPNKDVSASGSIPERDSYRTVVNFGALPNNGTKTVAHDIDIIDTFIFTHIYATATDQSASRAIPIPYASGDGIGNISLSVDGTNVRITTSGNVSSYNECVVVLEYIKG